MFVRWQKRKRKSRAFGGRGTDTHWAAILAESSRVAGKPTQQHVAYLGGITDSAIEIAAQRAFFWKEVMQQLDQLANRVLKDDRARIEEAIAEKVPRLSRQEYHGCIARWTALGIGTDFGQPPPSFEICGTPRMKRRK
jgi:hypothetical protein